MKETGKEFFYVRMLGDFSITCEGKELLLGRKSTLKFIQMLQLVWLRGEKGITKEQLMKAIYDRSEVSDSNNSINNLLYWMRRQMVKAGLPKGEYISRKNGLYVPDENFPLAVDVHEFEEWAARGEEEADEETACACYREALELYQGELLPSISTEIWVMSENARLKKVFESCVYWMENYYRRHEEYGELEQLYERVIRLYPESSWQIRLIDLVFERGEYKRAQSLYNEMVSQYSEEMGMPPTAEMLRCYERISQIPHQLTGEIGEIGKEIWECAKPVKNVRKAYYCAYRGFVDVCHVTNRNMERSGRSVFLMLCTLVDYEGKMIRNQEKLKSRMDILGEVIGSSLRKGDVYTRYSNSQYLILLSGIDQKNCEIIYRRINRSLKEQAGSRAEIEYDVLSLAELRPPYDWE